MVTANPMSEQTSPVPSQHGEQRDERIRRNKIQGHSTKYMNNTQNHKSHKDKAQELSPTKVTEEIYDYKECAVMDGILGQKNNIKRNLNKGPEFS